VQNSCDEERLGLEDIENRYGIKVVKREQYPSSGEVRDKFAVKMALKAGRKSCFRLIYDRIAFRFWEFSTMSNSKRKLINIIKKWKALCAYRKCCSAPGKAFFQASGSCGNGCL
jgi:hypothetical protein